MKRPNGISLFIQSNHQAIAEYYHNNYQCPVGNGCREVSDCNGDCKKTIKFLFLILCLFISTITFSQTTTVKLSDGNYVTQKVIFISEQQVVDYYGLVPTLVTYTDVKGAKYKVYTKSENVYYIKEAKLGFRKIKINYERIKS